MNNAVNIKSSILTIILVMGFASMPAHAFGTAEDVDQSSYVQDFKALDTDHDGTLSRKEASKDELFAKHFSEADKDHDGTLTQEEYTNFRSAHEKKESKRMVSDSYITSKVKAALLKDEGMKSMKVSVKTEGGVVQLSGFVDSEDQIKQAGKIAAGVNGVKSVKNSLLLKKN